MMLASFKIKGSEVSLDGKDISGVGNTLEILIHAEIKEYGPSRVAGKVSTLVKHKAYFRSRDIEELEEICSNGSSYKFTRETLEYQMDDVVVGLSKHEIIAGVIPVEIAVSGEQKPTCKRLATL